MTINQAIKRAIEGGYKAPYFLNGWPFPLHKEEQNTIFLDRSFWQSLGEALEWGEHEFALQWKHDGVPLGDTHWLYEWHRFIDHLAEGKDAESYFASLQ